MLLHGTRRLRPVSKSDIVGGASLSSMVGPFHTMKLFAGLFLALLPCGCTGPEHVSPAKFKVQYAAVGKGGTMLTAHYLGQHDGRAFIRVSSMSTGSGKWLDHIIYVELAELEPTFRDSLPKTEMKSTR